MELQAGASLRRSSVCFHLQFDVTKISDIYDALKYNVLHNDYLCLPGVRELFPVVRALAVVIVPQVR